MKIFEPLYDLVSWIILTLHSGFRSLGMNESWSWCLGIVGLVVLIRICLIPLFVKQIKSMRGMQKLQPEIRKIQQRYKGDRERTSAELMKLYKEHNTNPLSSCFPILAQAPIFFALYRVLDNISKEPPRPIGVLDSGDVASAADAHFITAPLSERLSTAESVSVYVITIAMIVAMSASQFFTQRQLMTKNMPPSAMESNPFLQQQKLMMYLFPLLFAVTGIFFPVGVLLYWLVSNFWSMGQQLFVIRRMPAEGSQAHEALLARKARKGGATVSLGKTGDSADGLNGAGGTGSGGKRGPGAAGSPARKPGPGKPGGPAPSANGSPAKRQQPKAQSRAKRASSAKKR